MAQDNIEEIKSKIDVVDLIQEFIQLKPAGANNFKANCPFHHEKTPSFMVSRDKQIWHCFGCFPKGSLVKTKNGFHPIEEVKKGDLVLTHRGRFKQVIRSLWRPYRGVMYDIKVRKLGETVSLTEDHKVFVMRTNNCSNKSRNTRICKWNCQKSCPTKYYKDYKIEKISASELSLNDYLLYPINLDVKEVDYINLTHFLTRTKYNFGPKIKELPKKIKVNNDFLRLLGYWIAEGSNHRAYIRFSLGNHEEDFAQEIVKLVKKVFNISASIHRRQGKKTGIEVTACNSNLANIFENLCGKGAKQKHIPFELQFLPPPKQEALLKAIWKGDGHTGRINKSKTKREFKAIKTISPVLSEQLRDILLRLKVQPNVLVQPYKIDKKGVRHQKSYTVQWQDDNILHFSDIFINQDSVYWLLPIREIRKRNFNDLVFNLTVSQDHSYVVNNFVVGNCGEGGDIFGFLMKMEGLEFPEALRILAKKAGVQLKYQDPAISSQKTKLLDICKAAANFYHKILLDHPKAEFVREYLAKRQARDDTVESWKIGYAPEAWETLNKYLVQTGFKQEDIFLAGLSLKKDRGVGYIDRFRNRLMFPINDMHGSVIGFGGRWLGEDKEGAAKYINSPQTLIYDKSRVLFGIDKAKQEIKKQKQAIVVEGYTDCIASHQAGVTNVVASSGTALTPDQVRLIKRFTTNVAFAFDQDLAGDSAAKRGIEVAWQEEISTKIIRLPQGQDPDDLIKDSPDKWPQAITQAQSIMEYYFDSTIEKLDLTDVEDKKQAAKTLLAVIIKLADPIEQTHYLQKLSSILDVPEEVLRDKLKQTSQVKKPIARRAEDKEEEKSQPQQDRFMLLAENIIGNLLIMPDDLTKIFDQLLPEYIVDEKLQKLYKSMVIYYTKKQVFNPQDFIKELGGQDNNLKIYAEVLSLKAEKDNAELEESEIIQEIEKSVIELKRNFLQHKLRIIERELKVAEQADRQSDIDELSQQFSELVSDLNKLE